MEIFNYGYTIVKKIQIQILYKNPFFGILIFLFFCGCTKGPYPNLSECPKFKDKPTISFEDVDGEISTMQEEVGKTKQYLGQHNATS